MAIIRDEAVVLSRLDYSETSQVLVLFTRQHGKVRAIARGIKRSTKTRFAVGIDLLEIGSVVFSSRQERSANLATLIEWKQTRPLPDLRSRLSKIHAAQYAAEVTTHLTEDWDPHVELFDALEATLITLSEGTDELQAVVRYQYLLLHAVGSMPRLEVCVRCGRGHELTHLSSFEGGMICRHCEPNQIEKWEVSQAALETLRGLSNTLEKDTASPPAVATAFGVLNYHISHLMGKASLLAPKLIPTLRQGRKI